jgi:Protein of unknown function (DUF1329)
MGLPKGVKNSYFWPVSAKALLVIMRGVYLLLARLRLRYILNEVTEVVKMENSLAFSIFRLIAIVFVFYPLTIQAQVYSDEELAATQLKLASPRDENPVGTLINQATSSEFHVLIPKEFQELVSNGQFVLSAFRGARLNGATIGKEWLNGSIELAKQTNSIEERLKSGAQQAFPYGTLESINQQQTLTVAERTQQLLWNNLLIYAAYASLSADITLQEISAEQTTVLKGQIKRVAPQKFRQDDRTGQLFREKFSISAPKSLKNMAWLTFRFIDAAEDVLWSHSPAINKTRQLVNSNRADGLLGSPISLDDFFGFSAKTQLVEGSLVSEGVFLTPFYSLDSLPIKPEEPGCYSFLPEKKKNSVVSGIDPVLGQKTITEPFFNMSNLNFIPRRLIRIELSQKDPYSVIGRQVVYLDAESFAAIYRITYDRKGSLQKYSVNAYALAGSTDSQVKLWLPTNSIIYDLKSKANMKLTYEILRICQQADSTVVIGDYDPKGLAKHTPESKPIITPLANETKS